MRLAGLLAFAYLVERLLDSEEVKNYAEAARRLGISKALMAAIAALRWLPVTVQEAVIEGRVRSERGCGASIRIPVDRRHRGGGRW